MNAQKLDVADQMSDAELEFDILVQTHSFVNIEMTLRREHLEQLLVGIGVTVHGLWPRTVTWKIADCMEIEALRTDIQRRFQLNDAEVSEMTLAEVVEPMKLRREIGAMPGIHVSKMPIVRSNQ